MHRASRIGTMALAAAFAALAALPAASQGPPASYQVPVDYHRLANGLKVVLSPDPTAPIVTVAVYYNIGFRLEPKGRTGFAHLFEHMMFQGSRNLGKMEFIRLVQSNGGVLNGSTRFDFTNYFEILPAHKLETALWAEADRMRGLEITQENLTNQQGVVKNEVKVNVLNRPYGGFPWLDLPQTAFSNWHNAHNFYGDLAELDAAGLGDVAAFFRAFYAPNNAVVVVVGDFEPAAARGWIERYFGDIPAAPPAARPDLTEPRQEEERRGSRKDPLATRPAFAFAYRMPDRGTPEYDAMVVLDQILVQGDDSLLRQALVQRTGITGEVTGGINWPLGNAFNYNGPNLWSAFFIHDAGVTEEAIRRAIDGVVERLRDEPIDRELLNRALIKLRSDFYDTVGGLFGFGRADLLACFALFDDDPGRINQVEERLRAVTPELILKTAREYLRPTARTLFTIEPGAGEATAAGKEAA